MLNLLVAHHAEASPFIKRYGLTRVADSDDLDYLENETVRLLIVGQGKDKCRISILRFIKEVPCLEQDRWMNFGIAGSSQFSVGELVRGASIEGSEYETHALVDWPTNGADQNMPGAVIRTVVKPERNYKESGVYDMECAELFALLRQHDYHKHFWVLKLVTDGPAQSVDKLRKREMTDLIRKKALVITNHSDMLLQSDK